MYYRTCTCISVPAMFPSAQMAWSLTLGWGDERRLMNIGTAPLKKNNYQSFINKKSLKLQCTCTSK